MYINFPDMVRHDDPTYSSRTMDHMFLPDFTDGSLTWGDVVMLASTHPDRHREVFPDRNTVYLFNVDGRGRQPEVSKEVTKTLQERFPDNVISSHIYLGCNENQSAFHIHRDLMDVLIVQQIGDIKVSIWEKHHHNRPDDLYPDKADPSEATCIDERILKPGDAVFLPRGTYHWIETFGDRATYSFGVEDLELNKLPVKDRYKMDSLKKKKRVDR